MGNAVSANPCGRVCEKSGGQVPGGEDSVAEFERKMLDEKLSSAFITSFLSIYGDLVEGKTGMIPETEIDPVKELPVLETLDVSVDEALLKQTVILKLNGGLGTGMGLEKAKSLLPVKGGDTFLDFIVKQVLKFQEQHPVKFMLMNSFSTSEDTKAFLKKYPKLGDIEALELMQNKAPKVDAETLRPAVWSKSKDMEWCPPGHGDIYAALLGSGKLDSLLQGGYKYAFVSNSDNLGATMDTKLLSYFAKSGAPMLMEVCRRTEAHKKGGHLARQRSTGDLLLRESAQCPPEDEDAFQNVSKHMFFNTNNLWLDLESLKKTMDANGGTLKLPMIRNTKTVDPRDGASPKVYQLETAMGAAIASLPGSLAVVVPTSRFAPVKTCDDLLVLRSDVYQVSSNFVPELATGVKQPPVVSLDKMYKMVDQMELMIPDGEPSLKNCTKLVVKGPVAFKKGTTISGAVTVENTLKERRTLERTVLTNETLTISD